MLKNWIFGPKFWGLSDLQTRKFPKGLPLKFKAASFGAIKILNDSPWNTQSLIGRTSTLLLWRVMKWQKQNCKKGNCWGSRYWSLPAVVTGSIVVSGTCVVPLSSVVTPASVVSEGCSGSSRSPSSPKASSTFSGIVWSVVIAKTCLVYSRFKYLLLLEYVNSHSPWA